MPTLVHLADEREISNIRRNGLKIGKHRAGIYCMPVLDNFYISHQWLRELKRSGIKTFVGVYFKMDSNAMIFAGKYNEQHKYITLGEAIQDIKSLEDPLGYEIIIDRKIEAKEIEKIRILPQNIGWRFQPQAKGQKPCNCDYCTKSTIKGNRIRQKHKPQYKALTYTEIIEKLNAANDTSEIRDLLWQISEKTRKSNPKDIIFLLDRNSVKIDREIALTLKAYKHKETKEILLNLIQKNDAETKEYATDSFLKLYGDSGVNILVNSKDKVIQNAINEWNLQKI